MATRTISTRLAIEGEAQYKQTIAAINAELKNHKSALDLVLNQYKSNANSMEALQAKQKALSDLQATQARKVEELNAAYQNAQSAVDAYRARKEELTKKIEENEAALEALKNTEGDTTEEQRKLTEETEKLKKELEDNEAKLAAAEKGANNWKTSLNKAQVELNNTTDELQKTEKYLQEASRSADKCATSIDRFGNETKDAGNAVDALGSALTSAGIVAALKQMADALGDCIKASIEFESAMTGVEKTTDMTDDELNAMADALKGLSKEIPMAASDLAEIAENAGQLGIQKENLVGFTRVMADLGVATNLTGEQAAQTFAKFANITRMSQSDFDKLGSAIVELGNNLATTEADIAEMAIRLAAAGTQAGMSQADILGLAGALSSVGLEAEAGGSAFSKAINMMTVAVQTGNERLADFAAIAGMSAEEFARAFREDAASAVIAFTEGLGNMELHGKNAAVLLEELGLKELRLRDALTRAASSGDLFRTAIERSNKAWAENSALTREAELRYGTTESRLKLLDNAFSRLKTTIGDQLNPALNGLIDAGINTLDWIDEFVKENEWLVPVITGLSVAIGVLATAMVFLSTTVQTKVIPAIIEMGKALMANPVALVIAGVAALTTALISLSAPLFQADEESQKLAASTKALAEEMDSAAEAAEKADVALAAQEKTTAALIERLEKLSSKTNLSRSEQILLKGVVEELADLYPEINEYLSENTDELRKNIPAIKDRIEALIVERKVQQQRDRIIELETEQAKAEEQLAINEAKRQKILDGLTDEQKKYIDDLKNTDIVTRGYYASALMFDEALREAVLSLNELEEADADLRNSLEDTNEELRIRNDWFNANAETLEKYGITMEEYTAATANMTAAQRAQYDQMLEYQVGVDESLNTIIQDLENLKEAHEEAYEKAYESIDGQIGLFENMSIKGKANIKDLIASLDSQIKYMDDYSANIKKAMEMGVDKGLIAKLSDGSRESAKILAGIVQGGEEDIKKLNEKFGMVEEGKQKFSTTVANMQTDFYTNMDAIYQKLNWVVKEMDKSDEAAKNARETGDSYAAGLRSRINAVYNAAKALAQAANKGWNDYYQKHSPAKVAIKAAAETADSYAMGFEQRMKHMQETTKKFALAANEGYAQTMKEIERYARPQNVILLPTAANNAQTAQQSSTKNINVNIQAKTVNADSLREIRREMIALQQRERLMEA